MKHHRREFLQLVAGIAAISLTSRVAKAQTYPTRPIHWMVGAAPGSSPDIIARIMGQYLSERLGQPVIIENRPGAGSNIAADAIARAVPDGYSLLFITSANSINQTLYKNLKFDFHLDISPVAAIVQIPLVMVVNPTVPANTIAEFLAYAKSNPGQIAMASDGNGTVSHVAGELFKIMAGVDMIHVPYVSGPPAMNAVMGGQVQVMFEPLTSSIGFIRAGKMRALAVTGLNRSESLPDVPAVGEVIPGYEATASFGLGVPKGIPAEIAEKLNQDTNTVIADARIAKAFSDLGGKSRAMTSHEYATLIAGEIDKWAKVIKLSGSTAE